MTIPTIIANRYHVSRTLGEGAMGLVLQAHDASTDQEVALKVISSKVGANAKTILLFKQEFRLMTQLRHPHCCAVYDYGVTPDGAPYFSMEVVPGQGLDECLPLDAERFKHIFGQLLSALGYLHQLGFVHRDLKSANVRVRPDGVVKLMDYGLMDFAGRSGAPISGTPAYMPPEVIKRGPIDQRADLYSAGCLAYELLSGQLPFVNDNPMVVLRAHVNDRPRPLRELVPGIPAEIERLVMRLLAKEPIERFRSADEVLEALGFESRPGAGGHLLSSPLMGREPEMSLLTERLSVVAAGENGGALIFTGASGLGKSRLLEEFRFAVQLENLLYAHGEMHDQGNAPYTPFVAALKSLLPAMRLHIPEELERHGAVLVKLLPGLDVPAAPDLDPPSKEKMRLQSVLASVLAALAKKQATVLVLEDWHWADPLSAEFLPLLLRNTQDSPLLVLLTARPTDGDAMAVDGIRRVPLGPLDAAGVRRMVSSMLGTTRVEEAFLAKVAEFSEGNPFFVKELLEHLVEEATLVPDRGQWNTDVELTRDRLPKNLKGLLMRKITYLPAESQTLARAAAVLGHASDITLLKHVTGFSDEALFAALEPLLMSQTFFQDEGEAYGFAQDQLQEMLYASMEPRERSQVHAIVALALEERLGDIQPADAPLDQLTAIAHHFLMGADADKIIVYALEAGIKSARLFANADAERFLNAGLTLVREAEGGRYDEQRFRYLRALGDVSRMTANVTQGISAYEEAIPLAEQLGYKAALSDLMTSLAKCHQIGGELQRSFAWCERSLNEAEAQQDTLAAARSLLTSCRLHTYRGNSVEALAHAKRALALATQAEDRFRIGEALAFIGYIYITSEPDKVQSGIEHLQQSLHLLTELGDKIGLQNSYNLLGNAQNMQGDFLAAEETFQRNLKVTYEAGLQDDETVTYLNLAICGLELGDFEVAAQHARAAHSRAHNNFNLGLSLILEATAQSYLGQFTGALSLIDQALKMALEAQNKYMETLVMQYKVEMYLVLGHLGEAKAAAKQLIALIKETGNTEPESRMNAFLGEIIGRQGDLAGGQEYVRLALSAAKTSHAKGIEARSLKVKAWIALQLGEWEEAKTIIAEALALSKAIGSRYLTTELTGMLGEIALATRQGDPLDHFFLMEELATGMKSDLLLAQALFGQAAATGAPMQAVPLVKRAQGLLEGLLTGLDEDSRLCFANLRERSRILEGDFIGGFKPRSADMSIKVSLPGIKLGQSMWGMN